MKKSSFFKATVLKDSLAVRCAEFNTKGNLYAVGSNSRNVYICVSNSENEIKSQIDRDNHRPVEAKIIKTLSKHHKGSIYCLSWSPDGRILATGSNDKSVKITNVARLAEYVGDETLEAGDLDTSTLSIHDGTVRDCSWIPGGQTLVSAGAGEDQIFLTDCESGEVMQTKTGGHVGHVMCVATWQDSHVFVTGGQDGHVVFWDSRVAESVHKVVGLSIRGIISSTTKSRGSAISGDDSIKSGGCVNSACVDPTGRLLVMAGEAGQVELHDIRGARHLQTLHHHQGEVRCVRLCPPATHLMSVGYDGKLILTDLQGDITGERPSLTVGRHRDKVVNVRWHPEDCSVLTCSADKTAALWTIQD